MAKALIISDSYGALATAYYKRFPEEPVSLKTILKVQESSYIPKTSLQTLLDVILTKGEQGTDLVIASHGNENGMIMPLVPGSKHGAVTNNLLVLMGSDSSDQVASRFALKPNDVDDLRAKADAVRKIGIGHVAFRGCSIGANKRNLETLKDLLGANEVTGTSLLSTYGIVVPQYPKKSLFEKKWESYGGKGHKFEGSARVVLWRGLHPKQQFSELIALWLESRDVMLEWLQAHLMSSTVKATATAVANKLPLHYLSMDPAVLPLDGTHNSGILGYADFINSSADP